MIQSDPESRKKLIKKQEINSVTDQRLMYSARELLSGCGSVAICLTEADTTQVAALCFPPGQFSSSEGPLNAPQAKRITSHFL